MPIASSAPPEAQWIEFPLSIGVLHQDGTQKYEDPSLGYTVRYYDESKANLVDVYVYPVAEEVASRGHQERVATYLYASQRDIHAAVSAGYYLRNEELGIDAFLLEGKQVLRSRHQLQTASGELYSLIYVTEVDGTVVKIRASVRGTVNAVVHGAFENEAFGLLEVAVKALDSAVAAEPKSTGNSTSLPAAAKGDR